MASHMSSNTQQTEHVAWLTLSAQHMGPSGDGVPGDRTDLDALVEAHADRLREQAERDLDEWEDLDAWMGYGDGYD